MLTNCTYLEDSGTTVEGYKIWGTPHQPLFHGWAFNRAEPQRKELFSKIPDGTDIVMCHGPPYGIRDRILDGTNVGCPILEENITKRVKPLLMAFGHIHEDRGVSKKDNTLYINSAMCTVRYSCSNPAIIVDLPRRIPVVIDIAKPIAVKASNPPQNKPKELQPKQPKKNQPIQSNHQPSEPKAQDKPKFKLNSALEKFWDENEDKFLRNPKSGKSQLEQIEAVFPPPANLQELQDRLAAQMHHHHPENHGETPNTTAPASPPNEHTHPSA